MIELTSSRMGFEPTTIRSRIIRDAEGAPPASCPGGIGNFGFNSYDLLTFSILVMGAISSAVIVNTNKNENNDNNNDLQASFGQINTNNQMASADQTHTNMAMIISPPAGPPVVIPIVMGRMLSNGTFALGKEASIPGNYSNNGNSCLGEILCM